MLATEASDHGVRINAIAPGWIESDIMRKALADGPERARKVFSRKPMNCFGTAEEVGLAATFLCAPSARFTPGVVLPVAGGASIGFQPDALEDVSRVTGWSDNAGAGLRGAF